MKLIYTPNNPDDTRQIIIIEKMEECFLLQAIKLIITPPEKSSILQKAIRQEANKIIIKYSQKTATVLAIYFYKKDSTTPPQTFYVNYSQNLPINEEQLISLVNSPYPESTPGLIKRSTNVINIVCTGAMGMMPIYYFGFPQGIFFSFKELTKGYLYQTIHEKIDDFPSPLKSRFKKGLKISSALLTLQRFTTLFSLFSRRRHDSYILDSQGFRTDITLRSAMEMAEEIIGQNASVLFIKPGLLFIKNNGFCQTIGSTDIFDFCQFTLNQPDYNLSSSQNTQGLVQYKAPVELPYLVLDNRPETLWSWIGEAFNNLLNSAAGYVSDYFTEDTDTTVRFSLQATVPSLVNNLTQWIAQPEVNATLVQGINDCLMESGCPTTSCYLQFPNNGTLLPGNLSSL